MADIKLKDRNDNEIAYTGVSKLKVPAAYGGEDVVFQLPPTLQKKTVSVTENGTTEITPDEGNDALSAVALTVDVPSSGAAKFIVNVTGSVNTGTLTSDHPFSEVATAYENGAEIECRGTFNEFAGTTAICTPVAYVAQNVILLSGALDFGSLGRNGLYQFTITATAANAWTITVNELGLNSEVISLANEVNTLNTSVETLTNNSQSLQNQIYSILAMFDTTIVHQMDDKYIKFSSATPFTIKLSENRGWHGSLQVKADNSISNWHSWSGEEVQSGNVDGNYILYVRGIGNIYINRKFVITGSNVACSGNVETLLDYFTVYNGGHPVMGEHAFSELFYGNNELVAAPELPATTLARSCYSYMFADCTKLTTPPELPATTLGELCYSGMFVNCTSLSKLPSLPAVKMQEVCYQRMFDGCSLIKLSVEQTDTYKNAYKIPAIEFGTYAPYWSSEMFKNTGGTFTGDPAVNTTYYTSNEIVGGSA